MTEQLPMTKAQQAQASSLRLVLSGLSLAIAYVGLEWISSFHEYKGLPFTAWSPGLGLLFAVMLVNSKVAIPALALGVAVSEAASMSHPFDWMRIAAVSIVITGTYSLAAFMVGKLAFFDAALSRLRDVVIILGAGIAGALVSAGLLLAYLISTGALVASDIGPAGLPSVIGDTIGIAVITPLCLLFASQFERRRFTIPTDALPELLCFILVIAIFTSLAFAENTRGNLQYFYVLFVPVVFSAVRHGLKGASIMLALTQAALVIILDWLDTDANNFTAYQTLMLVLTGTGLLVGSIVSERDIALQQAQAMQWEAARAARFNLVSGMAAALSHEISQPLTAARARARTIERLLEMKDIQRTLENLTPLVAQIDRAADILQRMREFLRRGVPDRKAASWDHIAGGARSLLGPMAAEKRVALDIASRTDLPDLMCDPVQIEQVLINLAVNAIEVVSAGGQNNGRIDIDAKRSADGQFLEISVRDNGPGIDPALSGNIFNAMTTTRQEGLGLGIAICVSIVESHNGRLWLESSEPGNTEFRFRIPAVRQGEQK